jgi:hypothetical protein
MISYIFKHISFLFEIFIMESWTFACLKIIPFKVILQSFLFPLGILRWIQLANLYPNVCLLSVKQLFRHKLWIKNMFPSFLYVLEIMCLFCGLLQAIYLLAATTLEVDPSRYWKNNILDYFCYFYFGCKCMSR